MLLPPWFAFSPVAQGQWTNSSQKPASTLDDQFGLANKLFADGDYNRSQRIFYRLVKAYPERGLYWFNLGNTYYMLGHYDWAVTSYQKVIALGHPLAPAARFYIAKCDVKLGQDAPAVALLTELSQTQLPPNLAAQVKKDLADLNTLSGGDVSGFNLEHRFANRLTL